MKLKQKFWVELDDEDEDEDEVVDSGGDFSDVGGSESDGENIKERQ